MAKTVADQFAEILVSAGVKRVYGIVGDSLSGLTDSIRRQGKIEWVHVRHEEVAAFAAGAEAHLTGELAVCAGSCGPGNLHLINGLFDCHRSRVPVLAIAAQIPSSEIGSGYFQETHPEQLFKECSHYCEFISGANQMQRTLELAIRQAVTNRGVSVVVIPGDVALQPAAAAADPNPANLLPARPAVPAASETLDRLAALLNGDSRVTMLCGSGCQGAHDQIVALAERPVQDYPGLASRPFTWEDSVDKFDRLVVGRADEGVSREIKEPVRSLESIEVKDLMQLLGRVTGGKKMTLSTSAA